MKTATILARTLRSGLLASLPAIAACRSDSTRDRWPFSQFVSSSFIEQSTADGESTYLRGRGSYDFVNGRVTAIDDGSRVYFLERDPNGEEHELVLLRRGDLLEVAVRHGSQVSALSAQDHEWAAKKTDLGALTLVPAPAIEKENERIASLRGVLERESVDWAAVETALAETLFPWSVMPEITRVARRPKISPRDETGLLHLAEGDQPLLRNDDRDAIVEVLAVREDLSARGVAAILSRLADLSFAKRTGVALALAARPSFDATEARALLSSIDDVPYEGRTQVLATLRGRWKICSVEEWLGAVLEDAPYDQRAGLVLDALASSSDPLSRAALARLDDFPYDRRTEVFTRCLQGGLPASGLHAIIDQVFDAIPFADRGPTIERLAGDPALGLAVVCEVINRLDDLPYDARAGFLSRSIDRGDLDSGTQVQLVNATIEDAPYDARGRVLRALLANPKCSGEARDTIWRRRKELPSGCREEIEELFRK